MLSKLGLIPNFLIKYLNLLTQDYKGNLTLVSNNSFKETISALNVPNKESTLQYVKKGSKMVFPEMSRINQVLKLEIALDKCYKISRKNYRVGRKLSMVQEDRGNETGT
jgi:hypothetical protein